MFLHTNRKQAQDQQNTPRKRLKDPYDDATDFVWGLYLGKRRELIAYLTSPFWIPLLATYFVILAALAQALTWSDVHSWLSGDVWLWGGVTAIAIICLYTVNAFIRVLFIWQTGTDYARTCQRYLTDKYDADCLDHIRYQAENQRAGLQGSSVVPITYSSAVWASLAIFFAFVTSQQQLKAGFTLQTDSKILISLLVLTSILFCVRFAEHFNAATVIVSATNSADFDRRLLETLVLKNDGAGGCARNLKPE